MPKSERPRLSERRPELTYLQLLRAYDLALEAALTEPSAANLARLVVREGRFPRVLLQPAGVGLGLVGTTPGSLLALRDASQVAALNLLPHHHGEWDGLDAFDRRYYELALPRGD
jgi:hypothetical protein